MRKFMVNISKWDLRLKTAKLYQLQTLNHLVQNYQTDFIILVLILLLPTLVFLTYLLIF